MLLKENLDQKQFFITDSDDYDYYSDSIDETKEPKNEKHDK